jgi:GxxExxY protein
MAVELRRRDVPFASQVGFAVEYDGEPLHLTYRTDFVCYDAVIVEIKALSGIGPVEEAQVLNYLKASRLTRALILNFGGRSLQWRRFVW